MAIKLTPESFLNVVRQSNLVTGDVLKRVVDELREEGCPTDSAKAIADQLVERNLLTRWQAEKLLQGKHKGFFLGKYRLLRLLGKGGMSSVYLAEHVLMRRQCAIKVLPTKRVNDTSYLGRFHREAQAVASLDHPNIVRAYDVDKEMEKDAEIHFLVMEFVDGRSLQEIIQQDGPLGYQTAADYIRQSAEGLAHAHEAGMVHRDIKPGNLLIDRNETIKLLDMGLARFFNEGDEESLTVAHDEKVLGTADYLAPEQALDSHSVDARADLYSLGCTFYFLLTGHPPFTEGTLAQRLMCHQNKHPSPVTQDRPDVPVDLLAILEKMMAKKREERYQTAGEIARDLGNWLVKHGSDEWQEMHPGLSGKKSGDNGQSLSSSKKKSSIVARPKVPAARPAAKEPAPGTSANPTPAESDAGLELSAFLANLGTSDSLHSDSEVVEDTRKDSPSSKPTKKGRDSGEIKPPAPARVQTAQPVKASPVGNPSAQAVPAKPMAKAKPVPGKPIATQPPSAKSVAANALAEEPEFPTFDGEQTIDTSPHLPDLTIADTPSQPNLQAPKPANGEWKDRLKDKRIRMGAGGIFVVLLSLAVYFAFFKGGDVTDPGKGNGKIPLPAEEPPPIGKPILVGEKEYFKSLKPALDYVAKNYDHFNATGPQDIVLTAGEVFEEGIDLESKMGAEFPEQVHIQTDPKNPATLKPGGTKPVIRLAKGINHLQISNLKIIAEGKNVAIHLQGELVNTRLQNLDITGYESLGIKADSIFGSPSFNNEERAFVIENCTFQGAGHDTTAILLENAGGILANETLAEIIVRDCRFLGPFKSALEVKNGVTSLQVLSCVFSSDGNGVGIDWTGTGLMYKVIFGNNTFYNLSQGIRFESQPGQVAECGIFRNLFSEIKQEEAVLLQGNALAFVKDQLGQNHLAGNVTTGGKTPDDDTKEINLFTGGGGRVDSKVDFVSTDPKDPRFLAPKNPNSLPTPGENLPNIGGSPVPLRPYIGAVGEP